MSGVLDIAWNLVGLEQNILVSGNMASATEKNEKKIEKTLDLVNNNLIRA